MIHGVISVSGTTDLKTFQRGQAAFEVEGDCRIEAPLAGGAQAVADLCRTRIYGADVVLQKPLQPWQLMDQVTRLIDGPVA